MLVIKIIEDLNKNLVKNGKQIIRFQIPNTTDSVKNHYIPRYNTLGDKPDNSPIKFADHYQDLLNEKIVKKDGVLNLILVKLVAPLINGRKLGAVGRANLDIPISNYNNNAQALLDIRTR